VNSRKDNKTPAQAGLRLLRKPKAPPPIPVAAYIRHAAHRDWEHFLIRKS
jgi:hypothetical protein